jgi:hypothetical protein
MTTAGAIVTPASKYCNLPYELSLYVCNANRIGRALHRPDVYAYCCTVATVFPSRNL